MFFKSSVQTVISAAAPSESVAGFLGPPAILRVMGAPAPSPDGALSSPHERVMHCVMLEPMPAEEAPLPESPSWPLWDRDGRLPPHGAGVITIGVNDLGWVVYDWTPGP